jgi:16S rRNA (adenine1518-N6/adenine1519-N6)-dimethyltransferase
VVRIPHIGQASGIFPSRRPYRGQGLSLRQKLGQHFLIRGSVLQRIARAACPGEEPLVIEIGPGRGALTAHLLKRAARVVAIELDDYLALHLERRFAGTNLRVIRGDALETPLEQWGPAVVAGNLPYYAATPIIERAVRLGTMLRRGVFLIQKEVAERMTAAPGQRQYGYLTLSLGLVADVSLLFDVPPAAFHPPPKVDSAVIRVMHRDRAPEIGIADSEAFKRFVALAFRHKRKTVRNNLAVVYRKEHLDALPDTSLRAEQIPLERFALLYRALVPCTAEESEC